jgi:hypothetical protein
MGLRKSLHSVAPSCNIDAPIASKLSNGLQQMRKPHLPIRSRSCTGAGFRTSPHPCRCQRRRRRRRAEVVPGPRPHPSPPHRHRHRHRLRGEPGCCSCSCPCPSRPVPCDDASEPGRASTHPTTRGGSEVKCALSPNSQRSDKTRPTDNLHNLSQPGRTPLPLDRPGALIPLHSSFCSSFDVYR